MSTPHFVFTHVPVRKSSAHVQVRDLVASGAYDVFFNLCDGTPDSDTAGVEVVQVRRCLDLPCFAFTACPH